MIRYFFCSFDFWKKLDKDIKDKFLFLATSYSIPKYYDGETFQYFVPSQQLFLDACRDFQNSHFEARYTHQIYSLDKYMIEILLRDYASRMNKNDIVFLVWESDNKPSERDIFMPWLLNLNTIKDVQNFSLASHLKDIQNNSNLFDI